MKKGAKMPGTRGYVYPIRDILKRYKMKGNFFKCLTFWVW